MAIKIFIIGGVTRSDEQSPDAEGEHRALQAAMRRAGRVLANAACDILVCSPFQGSSDAEVVRGAADFGEQPTRPRIEFYYPNAVQVVRQLDHIQDSLGNLAVTRFPQQPPADERDDEAWRHGWLLSELSAMGRSNVVLAVGGKLNGPMSLLLPLAESRRKPIVPLRFLGGAAEKSFERRQYELQDRLGDLVWS